MVQQIRILAVLAEDLNLVPSTNIGWLTTTRLQLQRDPMSLTSTGMSHTHNKISIKEYVSARRGDTYL